MALFNWKKKGKKMKKKESYTSKCMRGKLSGFVTNQKEDSNYYSITKKLKSSNNGYNSILIPIPHNYNGAVYTNVRMIKKDLIKKSSDGTYVLLGTCIILTSKYISEKDLKYEKKKIYKHANSRHPL